MKIKRSSCPYSIRSFTAIVLFSLCLAFTAASEIAYQESVSEVMIERFAVWEGELFLKELYVRLYFIPAWTKEEAFYGSGATLGEKNDLELEISRLYDRYVEYVLHGSINWSTDGI